MVQQHIEDEWCLIWRIYLHDILKSTSLLGTLGTHIKEGTATSLLGDANARG